MILDKIQQPNDIKNLSEEELDQLPGEIREFLIQSLSETGGHLASNLGVVELTMALHLSFNLPEDKIIWDVGHQAYTHKILTGRKDGFAHLRQLGGMSGFPKGRESDCDAFDTGHSSTSISAALGMAHARQLSGENYYIVAVIGDGSMTGGLAFEALNNVSQLTSNLIVVLNDNNMSISENVGGLNRYLSDFRTADAYRGLKVNVMNSLSLLPRGDQVVRRIRNAKSGVKHLFVPGMLFEELGMLYLGPVDGSNVKAMCKIFEDAKRVDGPVLVHVNTKKGCGFAPAERHPARFHGTEAYQVDTGLPKCKRTKANYTDVFGTIMHKLADRDEKVVAITAAMGEGTGLRRFRNLFPDRFFDVGIAEAHAVTFAAGMAKAGYKPVVAIYSSFLQRAYDQILHDVCIQNLPVVLAIDRAGLVGSDGETHHGVFDLSFLSSVPNMTIMAPKNKWELSDMMKHALALGTPAAVRYPKGEAYDGLKELRAPIEQGRSEVLFTGSRVALLAVGSMVKTAVEVREKLLEEGIDVTVVNARFVKPIDTECIRTLAENHQLLITMEENVLSGGFGEHVADFCATEQLPIRVSHVAVPNQFIEHGSVAALKEKIGLDAESVCQLVRDSLCE